MSTNRLWIVTRRYHQSQGIWYAEDDYRHTGYSSDWHEDTLYIVCPEESVARAAALDGEQHRPDAKMEIVSVISHSVMLRMAIYT